MSTPQSTAIEANGSTALDSDLDADSVGEVITSLADEIADLRDEVADLRDENEQLRDRVTELEEQSARDRAEIKSRVSDLEGAVSEQKAPTPEAGKTAMQQPSATPETPLEDLATVPERVLENESANTRRAVFVARDLEAYATSVPAGRAMSSTEVRRVLQAGTDASGHTQTVARVMSLLDDLGGDDTKIVERHGTRRIVFSDELVSRLARLFSGEPHGGDGVRA